MGADAIELLAKRHRCDLRVEKGLYSQSGVVSIAGRTLALAIPTTYMNESGQAAAPLMRRFEVEPANFVVVHDELDLAPAAVKLKAGGGLAGNNGLRSIKAHCKTDEFLRVRIGIGKPPSKDQGANHVLNKFGKADRIEIDAAVEAAADAVELILAEGIDAAMLRIHTQR